MKNKTTFLVVDDCTINRMVIKMLLEKNDYQVKEAEDGAQVINMIKDGEFFDIIWIDIQMPNIDGIKCTEILREKYRYSHPIIGITSHANDDVLSECLDKGMDNIITKPITESKLIDVAKRYIKKIE